MIAISALLNAVEPLWDFLKDVDPMDLVKFLVFYYRLPKGRSRGNSNKLKRKLIGYKDSINGITADVVEEYYE